LEIDTKMTKTKSQAEKRKEREEQIAEEARLRAEEAQRRREMHQIAQQRQISNSDDDNVAVVVPNTQQRGRARLVMNHSTHIDGLIELLRLVCIRLDSRFTITPGVIHSNQSLSSKTGGLSIRMQRSDNDNALRILAMNGGSAQEVFISFPEDCDESKIEGLITECLERQKVARNDSSDEEVPLINTNHQVAKERANMWKEEHKNKHLATKEAEAEAEERKALAERERTLRTKVGAEEVEVYAERDEAIIKGKRRGKYAMK
jgi:hypothetical protein